MATYKPQRIFKLMEDNNLPCFIVSDGKINCGVQFNETMSVTAAKEALKEVLADLTGNDVSIEIGAAASPNGKLLSKGRILFERVDLSDSGATRTINAISGVNDSPMLKVLMEKNLSLEKQLIEAEAQKKIDALTLRIEQIEKGDGSPINGLINGFVERPDEMINAIASIWQMIQAKTNPGAVRHLAGMPGDVESCIERLKKVDVNFEMNLKKLAELAETNPNKYFMAVSML